jgi:hypothetical protein
MRTGFFESFKDRNGAIGGSTEEIEINNALDGAVAEAFTWNVLDAFDDVTARATLDELMKLRVESGGFKRNDDAASSYDENEWILVDLRIADSLRRAGRNKEADGYVAQIVEKASVNFFLVPELYNAVQRDGAIGKYTGSIPMVGYGAGAYVLTMFDRAGLIEPNDCGDGKGKTLPKLQCDKIDTTPPSGGGPGGPGNEGPGGPGANVPYGPAACLCDLSRPHSANAPLLALLVPPVVLALRRRRRS